MPRWFAAVAVVMSLLGCVDIDALRARITCDESDPTCGQRSGAGEDGGSAGAAGMSRVAGTGGGGADAGAGAACDHRCDSQQLTRCQGRELSMCGADGDGCRDWVVMLECAMGCGDAVSCAGCTNECPSATECEGEGDAAPKRRCMADARGCLVLEECINQCPDDQAKTEPLECGCGVAEETGDRDDDGTIDCLDECPDECEPLGRTCEDGILDNCTMNVQGCAVLEANPCASDACWDGTRCAAIARFVWPGDDQAEPHAIAVDQDGYAFTAGLAKNGLSNNPFGGGAFDAFVTKWSPVGMPLWTAQWGDSGYEDVHDIAVNAAGDRIALAGQADDEMSVGVWSGDAAGPPIWLLPLAPPGYAAAIAYGPGGDVYVAGGTSGAFPDTTNLGASDAFLIRLNAATGAVVWARQFGGALDDGVAGIASDGTRLYVAGLRDRQGGDALTGDAFLTRFDEQGAVVWESSWDGGSGDRATAVAIDSEGAAIVSGTNLAIGEGGFLAKVNPAQVEVWQWPRIDAWAIAVDADGNSYSARSADVAMNDPSGMELWRHPVAPGGGLSDVATTTAPANALRVLATGIYAGKAFFGVIRPVD